MKKFATVLTVLNSLLFIDVVIAKITHLGPIPVLALVTFGGSAYITGAYAGLWAKNTKS